MMRFLIILGIIFIIIGLFYPLIEKLNIGRLPGDIFINKDNFKFYFPITTSILFSFLVTIILWLFNKYYH